MGHQKLHSLNMSDDEYETMSNTSMKGDEAFAKRKAGVQKNELNEQLKDYINQWREERSKEEAELKRMKDKQAARKEIRAEQEKKQAQAKREEEEKIKREENEKKAAEAELKKKQMEEAEIKRQEMMAAQKEGGKKSSAPALDARKEMSKTKEQVEEEMKISLRIRIKPLNLDEMDSDELRNKANKIWDTIVCLETDKYDYEQRQLDQDYELKELAERQKLQQRNKAIKKGLDPESFTGKHPPVIRMFSKYERRTDTRSYGDREELKSSAQRLWRLPGRRSWQSSRRGQLRDYQSGSVSGQARRLVIQRLLKAKREELVKKRKSSRRRKRRRKRRRRRRRRSKS